MARPRRVDRDGVGAVRTRTRRGVPSERHRRTNSVRDADRTHRPRRGMRRFRTATGGRRLRRGIGAGHDCGHRPGHRRSRTRPQRTGPGADRSDRAVDKSDRGIPGRTRRSRNHAHHACSPFGGSNAAATRADHQQWRTRAAPALFARSMVRSQDVPAANHRSNDSRRSSRALAAFVASDPVLPCRISCSRRSPPRTATSSSVAAVNVRNGLASIRNSRNRSSGCLAWR